MPLVSSPSPSITFNAIFLSSSPLPSPFMSLLASSSAHPSQAPLCTSSLSCHAQHPLFLPLLLGWMPGQDQELHDSQALYRPSTLGLDGRALIIPSGFPSMGGNMGLLQITFLMLCLRESSERHPVQSRAGQAFLWQSQRYT